MTYWLSLVVDFPSEQKNIFSKMIVVVQESANRVTGRNLLDWVYNVLDVIHAKAGSGLRFVGQQNEYQNSRSLK